MADQKTPRSDLEKDLAQGNADVQAYLNEQAVKQGHFDPDVKESAQNDPKNATVIEETVEEVAAGAVEKKSKK